MASTFSDLEASGLPHQQPVFAEYLKSGNIQFDAPHSGYRNTNFEPGNLEGKTEYPAATPESVGTTNPRICGLSHRVFWLVVALMLLLVVGGVVGGAVGATVHNKSTQSVSSESSASLAAGSTMTATTVSNQQQPTSPSTPSSAVSTLSINPTLSVPVSTTQLPLPTTPSTPSGPFDSNTWYRFTNAYLGPGIALDVVNDAGTASSGALQMATLGPFTGQYWQFHPNPDGTYALSTQFLGSNMRLDVAGISPHLAPISIALSQAWTFVNLGDGTWHLANGLNGPAQFMDTYADTHQLFMEGADHTGQHWTIAAIQKIS